MRLCANCGTSFQDNEPYEQICESCVSESRPPMSPAGAMLFDFAAAINEAYCRGLEHGRKQFDPTATIYPEDKVPAFKVRQ